LTPLFHQQVKGADGKIDGRIAFMRDVREGAQGRPNLKPWLGRGRYEPSDRPAIAGEFDRLTLCDRFHDRREVCL
jgi:hypothetical protein